MNWRSKSGYGIGRTNASRKLEAIPGIGPITASAIVATVGDAREFKNGRQMAAWMGLVPRQNSSGGKQTLLGISKRGDVYLRTLLIHGARAVIRLAENKAEPSSWLRKLMARRNKNVAAVALANKNARIVWALLANDQNVPPRLRPCGRSCRRVIEAVEQNRTPTS